MKILAGLLVLILLAVIASIILTAGCHAVNGLAPVAGGAGFCQAWPF